MTFFKKIPDLRQSAWGWRAPGLLVALVLVFQPQKATAQQTQTITLSTGLVGQAGTTLTALWHLDDDWLVTADPINTAVPRSANVVSTDKKWPAPFPHSQWISAAGNKYLYALQGRNRTPFTYQSCFNLPQFFSAPKLTMQLRADDIIRRVKLNNTIIFEDPDANAKAGTTKPGSQLGPPLQVPWTTATDFQAGQNCLEVAVEDVQQVITGLNVAVTVTYQYCSSGQVVDTDLSTGTTNGVKNPLLAMDPKWKVNLPNLPPTFRPAYSTATVANWVANAPQPANWIGPRQNANPQDEAAGTYTYRVQFPLNTSLYTAHLTLRYAADNSANVILNAMQVAVCPGPNCFSNWQPASGLSLSLFGPFLALNNLDVVVTNKNDPSYTGLIVDAKLRAACK